ncbi:uncharacterized protein BYT42DRAFT_511625 [Radiomyces spectabilis]|uniref:uncharacterized protein n=1 Tax=Radiomyces spectabilis TaxID=64574 RepID=UPI00221FA03C|nr:uncharacterized protein BYT42DRAFT_511625 [Radiomyces spectabilis]KAI8384223.1 hypothetical protein BYT42DRAFT_511625 [Radiomyces spectabilis]
MAVIEEVVEQHEFKETTINATPIGILATSADADSNKGDPEQVNEKNNNDNADEEEEFFDSSEYHPEELERILEEATEYKQIGNRCFAEGDYDKAIAEYENALLVCPPQLPKDRALYFGNIAACHLKMNNYKDARDMASRALDLDKSYTKALLRRAQANERIGSYTALSDALEDYKRLSTLDIDTYTRRECDRAKARLPPIIKVQMEKEKEEMMGKLKDLGNTILGKFGLSTDNFQMQKDPATGGYSMNFVNK